MISIIVPIYNAERYLEACLDSLLSQSEKELQILLVDDGSTDGSLAIAKEYAAKDTRVEVFHQSNAGQSAARNVGLQHAKGEFIAFVDADDKIAEDWCERHLEAIEGADYIQSGYLRVEDGQTSEPQIPQNRYRFTSPCMRLYRRQTIEGMRFTEGMIYEDVVWSVDLWLSGARCRIIPYCGYRYTANPESTTSRRRPEAERCLFAELRKRLAGTSCKGRLIIWYTLLRLKIHFRKQ